MKFSKFKKNESNDPFSIKEGRFGGLNNFSYRLNWTEDTFVSGAGCKETLGRTFNFKRVYFVGAVLVFFLSVIVARTAWLQIVKGEYYYSMAEGNRIRIERLEARRGVLYDRDHKTLVRNVANFMLYFIPADLPSDEEGLNYILKRVSEVLGEGSEKEIREKLFAVEKRSLESYRPLFITDNIDYDKAMKLYLESVEWSGVILSNKTRRQYDLAGGLSLSHILGYTGKINDQEILRYGDDYLPIDYLGKNGIEYFWESELRGTNGKKQIEVDAMGKEKKIISQMPEVDGHNLVLSIDTQAQRKLEEILQKQLDKVHLKKGVAIVMDPNNGEIISSVSIPAYDNNSFARGIKTEEYKKYLEDENKPLFNRAINGEYPSGSTIKPVMAAAALQEGIINENTSFVSTGGLRIGEWYFPDWKGGGHGVTNVRKALAESVNTFFYYIGGGYNDFKGLGVDRIVRYEKLFGLGAQTGIDLAGEADGFLPSKEWKEEEKNEKWYIGDTYHLSIGQGDLTATPLQIVNFTSFFANGGKLYQPHIVKEIMDSQDKVIKSINGDIVRQGFVSDQNVRIVREGMRQTITSGSARSLNTCPVEVAGKTGTAQWSTKKNPHAWFAGFAPYNNPKIAFTILIEEGKEGSSVAVPVAREFIDWYFRDRFATSTPATSTDLKK